MAKKLGKAAKTKKGVDGRDLAVIGVYILFFVFVLILIFRSRTGNQKVEAMEKEFEAMKRQTTQLKRSNSASEKDLATSRSQMKDSEDKIARERQEYDFVVGTSLEYAKKSALMMAIWEAIDKVRSVALRSLNISKNEVTIEMITPSGVYLTDFIGTLYKRTDIIETVQVIETKQERSEVKEGEEVLAGKIKIVAKAK